LIAEPDCEGNLRGLLNTSAPSWVRTGAYLMASCLYRWRFGSQWCSWLSAAVMILENQGGTRQGTWNLHTASSTCLYLPAPL